MQETFKGESKIIERLKAEAVKAAAKHKEATAKVWAIEERLNGFGYTFDEETGEIKTKA